VFARLRHYLDRRYLARNDLDPALFARALALPALAGLRADEHAALRRLAVLFLRDKRIFGARGFATDAWVCTRIAVEAALLVRTLSLDRYRGFRTVVVYEDTFIAHSEEHDEDGLVHVSDEAMGGQSWEDGPVILSWADMLAADAEGGNIVLHEFAHKLDMENGGADGYPRLAPGMQRRAWTEAFASAFHVAGERADAGRDIGIDEYALESPAEFFSMAVEAFFMQPSRLANTFPAVYAQLELLLGEPPRARLPAATPAVRDPARARPAAAADTTARHPRRRPPPR
jgi:hypothetical protein